MARQIETAGEAEPVGQAAQAGMAGETKPATPAASPAALWIAKLVGRAKEDALARIDAAVGLAALNERLYRVMEQRYKPERVWPELHPPGGCLSRRARREMRRDLRWLVREGSGVRNQAWRAKTQATA